MTTETTKWIDNITNWLSWSIWNISETLKDLMEKIMWPINEILANLWLKQKVETKNEIDKTKIDLKKLMNDVKLNVEIDHKLNAKEKLILDWLLEKNKDLKTILERTKTEFWGDVRKRESAVFMSMLKKETDWWKIEQSELDDIIKNMNENKKQIEWDKKLKWIIKGFPNIKNTKNGSSIDVIVTAYNDVKEEKENNNNKEAITIDDVFNKID